jgi:acetylornithine deacetylase/succinyl-diaminopimelate desuccinylase-like protein
MRRWSLGCLVLVFAGLALACGKEKPRPGAKKPSLEADQTRPAQEWLKEEPVRLLRDYIRIDTTSETKGEKAGAEFLKAFFDCAGIENEIVCPAPGRCNLLARLPGKRREGALLLLNHIDVAEASPRGWADGGGPFEGKIKNGFLYGRGAYDMKSLALTQALAMRRLKERGKVPASDILFLAEADEEVGQKWGSRWLLENRPEWFQGVSNVLNDGATNETLLRDVRFWGVETIQAGYAIAELESTDKGALEDLARRFSKAGGPVVEPHPHVVLGFDMLANHLGSPLTDPLRHLDRVRNDRQELDILPDRYASFLEPRIHWIGPYPFPPEQTRTYRAFVIVSIPPGLDPQPYLAPILDALGPKVRVVRKAYGGPAGASPYPTPLTEIMRRVAEAHTPGVPFGPMPTFGGYTTSVLFRQKGYPTYGYSPIVMNITDAAKRHGADERVFLRDYLRGVDMYGDFLEDFASTSSAPP